MFRVTFNFKALMQDATPVQPSKKGLDDWAAEQDRVDRERLTRDELCRTFADKRICTSKTIGKYVA